MRKFFSLFMFCLLFCHPAFAASVGTEGFADLLEKLLPAVVNVSTEQKVNTEDRRKTMRFPGGPMFEEFREFFERMDPFTEKGPDSGSEVLSLGSGFIIDASGIIVTNCHVVANAKEVMVTLSDNTQFKAAILGHDERTDLAVLKVEAGKPLPCVKFGDSDKMRVGDVVIAIGNPFGLGGSVSTGIISARARDISLGTMGDFIQTDAAINKGNSGGPLFNTTGEVIGINAAIVSPSGGNVGLGFAIPSNSASPIITILESGKKVEHGWVGVKIQAVTKEVADSLGMSEAQGALVAEVTKGSPADKAGIRAGDVIVEFSGVKITKMPQLLQLVSRAGVDVPVKVQLYRDGKLKVVTVNIGKLQNPSGEEEVSEENLKSSDLLGLKVVELSDDLRSSNDIRDDVTGVLILKVDGSSDAFNKGLRRGDVISTVNQTLVKNVEDFNKIMASVRKSGRNTVLLLVNRGGSTLFVSVKVK